MTHIACISLLVVGVCCGVGIGGLLVIGKIVGIQAMTQREIGALEAEFSDLREALAVEFNGNACREETEFAISAPEEVQVEILWSQYMLQDCRGLYGKNPFDDQEGIDELG